MATILFVVPRFHTNLFFATRALLEADHRVEVAVADVADGEDHTYVRPLCVGPEPDAGSLRALVDRVRPDLVIVRGSPALIRQASVAARRHGREVAVFRYDQRPATRVTSLGRRLRNALGGIPARRITPVPGLQAEAPRDPMAVCIPLPVAALPHDLPARPSDGPVRVLCVGKLAQRRKNQHLLIAALRSLASASRRLELTLVGSSTRQASGADESFYDAHLAAVRAEPWIELLSDRPFAEMTALYAAHDICVLPSVGEPLGSSPIEGMAYGTIPVVSVEAGSAGFVDHERTGLRVDMSMDGALTEALASLLDDPALRKRLSDGARRFAEDGLSPARSVARTEALLPTP
ncbi:glycosyltransferase family 4 protein [Jannaschia rubra]|uniref:glycosyltransferase family 4 protein n=1 Tax=Jannaschia rubra TaxID=282197 RepID=UPI0024939ABE|nr:glycosyltransferase family 4 protein [Jannaschia rubra]